MPKSAKTHNEMRTVVCAICTFKGSSPRKITGKCLERVKSYVFTNYNPEDINYPSHACSRCYKLLENIEKGVKTIDDLPDPLDLSEVKLPDSRMTTRLSSPETKTHCDCYICEEGGIQFKYGNKLCS